MNETVVQLNGHRRPAPAPAGPSDLGPDDYHLVAVVGFVAIRKSQLADPQLAKAVGEAAVRQALFAAADRDGVLPPSTQASLPVTAPVIFVHATDIASAARGGFLVFEPAWKAGDER